MKQYILFTDEELEDLINGREVKLRTSDNKVLYFKKYDAFKHDMQFVHENENITKALEIAWKYSQIDGAHHKAWTIDQMIRALCGDEKTYKMWVSEYTKPFLNCGELDHYNWDEGIAP
jgi:hypothetical protein